MEQVMVKLGELTRERSMGSGLPGASVSELRPSLGLALRSWGGPSVVGPRRPLSRAHMSVAAEHFRCNRELRPMWRTASASSSVGVTLDVASSGELEARDTAARARAAPWLGHQMGHHP